jgi:hypothetical protein
MSIATEDELIALFEACHVGESASVADVDGLRAVADRVREECLVRQAARKRADIKVEHVYAGNVLMKTFIYVIRGKEQFFEDVETHHDVVDWMQHYMDELSDAPEVVPFHETP